MPLPQVGNCQYTLISSNGTTTLNPGQSGVPGIGQQGVLPASFGAFYGADLIALGTAPTLAVLDLVPTGTSTLTNTIFSQAGTAAGQNLQAGVPGVGIRYKGALVAVTGGTAAGTWAALWD